MTSNSNIDPRRPVLAPVDFSTCSRSALLFAARFAEWVQAPLLILHVVHESGDEDGFYRRHDGAGSLRILKDVAEEMLRDSVAELATQHPRRAALAKARLQVVEGLPVKRILEVVASEDPAIVVMGSHAREGLSRLLHGSVAEEVAKHSPVPVTIVKMADSEKREWWSQAGEPEPLATLVQHRPIAESRL